MLRGISKQQKQERLHTRLNNFPVFRNYRDIDFALRCMDVLATNAQTSVNRNLMLNFVQLKQRIFKRLSHLIGLTLRQGILKRFKFLTS